MKVHRFGIHTGEEPGIIGNDRSGMIVFAGCHLRCSFCYTPEAAFQGQGEALDLKAVFESLLEQGARNLNFISPSHVWPQLKGPLIQFRKDHPGFPVILKVSGYEGRRLAREFSAHADVIVMDFKVATASSAKNVNLPANYSEVAQAFLIEASSHMPLEKRNGVITRGVVVRTLWLPSAPDEASRIGERLALAGYRGPWNLMRFFIDPQKRLLCAPDAWAEGLRERFPTLELWRDGRCFAVKDEWERVS
jgi:putative pyruvate formate lyase activating enzyme